MIDQDTPASFDSIKERLDAIADEVSREDLSLDDALALYEEAVGLGIRACDASEADLKLDEPDINEVTDVTGDGDNVTSSPSEASETA